MTLKALAQSKISNGILAQNAAELDVIYTVPAAKSAIIKEILIEVTKIGATTVVHCYVLKSAGTDITTAPTALQFGTFDNIVASPGGDVIPETVDGGITAQGLTVLARNTILLTGDKIKIAIGNVTVGGIAADAVRVKTWVSGDEF